MSISTWIKRAHMDNNRSLDGPANAGVPKKRTKHVYKQEKNGR